MKAILKNYRQAPRKVRLVADFIRGKQVDEALASLRFLGKRAAGPVEKVLKSAIANAKENHSLSQADEKNLYVKEVRVDDGFTLKRFMPKAQGRATTIHKRTSHIQITLDTRTANIKPKAAPKKKVATK